MTRRIAAVALLLAVWCGSAHAQLNFVINVTWDATDVPIDLRHNSIQFSTRAVESDNQGNFSHLMTFPASIWAGETFAWHTLSGLDPGDRWDAWVFDGSRVVYDYDWDVWAIWWTGDMSLNRHLLFWQVDIHITLHAAPL